MLEYVQLIKKKKKKRIVVQAFELIANLTQS